MREPSAYYLTTAIDYPNSRPHIGTAFEKIGADAQARYRRMDGRMVRFQMGNDENTIKVSQKAAELGLEPKAYVDDMARQFREVWDALDISYDDFIQTSEERHHIGCQKFLQAVYDAGDIYKKPYTGLYCTGCEAFKTEKEVIDTQGRCPNHPQVPLKVVEEENYFFRLSHYSDRLLNYYEDNPEFIQPESRRNEIISLIKNNDLQDISVSRKGFVWGIKVPFDHEQTIYVWFDALLNYITAIGYGWDEAKFRSLWPACVHVIGKDITRFHCAFWPAMLMSAGLPLPKQVFGHGFVYNKHAKISKSSGTAIDPMDVIRAHGSDPFRYYFLKECPFGGDGNYSEERFAEVYDSDLASNLGNMYSRTLTMVSKYFNGQLDGIGSVKPTAWLGSLGLRSFVAEIRESIETFHYNVALKRIWLEVLDAGNRYIDHTQPFKLINTDPDATKVVLANLVETVRVLAILLKPFLPKTAEKFYSAFDFETSKPWDSVSYNDAASALMVEKRVLTGALVNGKPPALFPRISDPKVKSS